MAARVPLGITEAARHNLTLVLFLAVLAFLISLAALGLALEPRLKARRAQPVVKPAVEDLPSDVVGLRQEVAALRLDVGNTLRNVSVVRYDAFGDVGGKLSFSLALLDDHADGVVVSAIHGRNDTRTYAKSVTAGTCEQPLSPEEEQAIRGARA